MLPTSSHSGATYGAILLTPVQSIFEFNKGGISTDLLQTRIGFQLAFSESHSVSARSNMRHYVT